MAPPTLPEPPSVTNTAAVSTPDLAATLAAIDAAAVHHCGHCDAVLGPDALSKYWCDDECQEAWNEARSEPLVGYQEPTDLPEHINNQVETWSAETAPPVPVISGWDIGDLMLVLTGNVYYQMTTRGLEPIGNLENWQPTGIRNEAYPRRSINWGTPGPRPITWQWEDETFQLWQDTRERLGGQLATWRLDDETWQHPGLWVSFKEPEPPREPPPDDLLDGLEWNWKPVALLSAEPLLPIMASAPLDIEAIQRQIDGYRAPSRRRIDARGSR